MRYVVKWVKNGTTQQLAVPDATPGRALGFAAALLETRPSDIWIETQSGRKVASYEDIISEGPLFSAHGLAATAQP